MGYSHHGRCSAARQLAQGAQTTESNHLRNTEDTVQRTWPQNKLSEASHEEIIINGCIGLNVKLGGNVSSNRILHNGKRYPVLKKEIIPIVIFSYRHTLLVVNPIGVSDKKKGTKFTKPFSEFTLHTIHSLNKEPVKGLIKKPNEWQRA